MLPIQEENQCWKDEVVDSVNLSVEIIFQKKNVFFDNDTHEDVSRNVPEQDESTSIGDGSPGRDGKQLQLLWDKGNMRSLSGGVFVDQGKSLRIKVPFTAASRTLSVLSYLVQDDIINQPNMSSSNWIRLYKKKTELQHAHKMLERALIELYKEMDYLEKYRTLNMLAFSKILKKFDKVTGKHAELTYLREVETSYFNSSNKVGELMNEVEQLFTKNFTEDDQKKAMSYLKPFHRKESHATTFFIGLFVGCLSVLLVGYSVVAHAASLYTDLLHPVYMETAYPVLSIFSLLFLHFFLYGCNILLWRKARVNYSFIFEFNPTKHLKYKDVFLISAASMATVIGVMLVHSYLTIEESCFTEVRAIPFVLFLFFLAILLCPLNVVYRSSRLKFLSTLRKIVLAPFYKVAMIDFFVADQFCSQVPMLRDLAHMLCYYVTGSNRRQDYGYCARHASYKHLPYLVSFLPYYWRAMQCARRWFDEGQTCHLVNMGKYVSAMLAGAARVAYEKEKTVKSFFVLVLFSSIATVYQLYWDFVKDWGLLQFKSRNPGLRNELMIRWKSVYFLSIALNIILRLAWLQIVLHLSFGGVDRRVTSFFLAALEVVRRGQGNFYRLENEHLNNTGNFRAVKTVPLPFEEVDEN